MIHSERTADYLDSLCPGNSDLIEEIRNRALAENMPIIRRDGESFLKTVLAMSRPKRILEVGTNVGYSAIIMAEAMKDISRIITLEIGDADYLKALENVKLAGYEDVIECRHCDASEELKKLVGQGESFDFVFMDAAKAQYIKWLPDVEALTGPGAVLLSDNVLHDGDIAQSRFAVERRDRTTHARLREYLWELTHSKNWTTSVINVADGMAVSVRL